LFCNQKLEFDINLGDIKILFERLRIKPTKPHLHFPVKTTLSPGLFYLGKVPEENLEEIIRKTREKPKSKKESKYCRTLNFLKNNSSTNGTISGLRSRPK